MKKMLAMVLVVAMLMSIASIASAATLWVTCTDTTTYKRLTPGIYKHTGSAAIYVKHSDNVDTEEYTNHFRGQEGAYADTTSWTTRGSKWCTQHLNVPIQNANITTGKYYTVSARGNTNYYNYDGISSISLNVTINPNLF